MAGKCSASLGNLKSEAPSVANIISGFNAAYEWLSEHEVPAEEQVIFVSPKIMSLIRGSSELTRFLTQADYKNGDGVEFTLKAYEGRPIIEVPSNRFLSAVSVTDNGFIPGSGAYAINYMVVSKRAVVPLRKLEYSKIFEPAMVQDYYGYKIDYLLYHGIIIPKNKVPGIFCSVSSSVTGASVAGVLSVLLKTGTGASGTVLFDEYFTQPAGLLGTVAYQKDSSAITTGLKAVGDAVTIDGTNFIKLEPGDNFSPSSDVHCQFVLVGSTGTALAVTGDIDVTSFKKA
jgi:hypothetical protein